MVIGLDLVPLVTYKDCGIGNYVKNFYRALFEIKNDVSYVLLNWYEYSVKIELGEYENYSEYFVYEHYEKFDWNNLDRDVPNVIRKFVNDECIDVFYTTNTFRPSFPIYRKEWFGSAKLVMTVHDITPLILKNICLNIDGEIEAYKKNCSIVSKYDMLFANSENTRKDIKNYLGTENIYNISMSMDKKTCNNIDVENAWNKVCNKWEKLKTKKYFLFVGGSQINKNLNRTLRAYRHMLDKLDELPIFVIIGRVSDEVDDDLHYFVKRYHLEDKIVTIGYVNDAEMIALYRNALWMIFPSLYEGFGMPVLESWNEGCPVITSNNSSLGEIAGGASIQVDPFSVDSIENGLLQSVSMTDSERYEYIIMGKERLRLFSWEKTANEALELMNKL